jgi:hypothetical protein
MKSFYCYWIGLIIIGEFLHYGHTQDLDPLLMDQAYINVTNEYPETITVLNNSIVCERCDFDTFTIPLNQNSTTTVIIENTKHPHEFQLRIAPSNKTVPCNKNPYSFIDGGSYSLRISSTEQDEISCVITAQHEPFLRYWLPVILGTSVIILLIIFTQIWHRLSRLPRFVRWLPEAVKTELITNDLTASLPRTPGLITNDNDDNIIDTLMTDADMPLTASNSRILSSPLRPAKSLPRRLRSLDAFRGFSLMAMIFVNYGGLVDFNQSFFNSYSFQEVVIGFSNTLVSILFC